MRAASSSLIDAPSAPVALLERLCRLARSAQAEAGAAPDAASDVPAAALDGGSPGGPWLHEAAACSRVTALDPPPPRVKVGEEEDAP